MWREAVFGLCGDEMNPQPVWLACPGVRNAHVFVVVINKVQHQPALLIHTMNVGAQGNRLFETRWIVENLPQTHSRGIELNPIPNEIRHVLGDTIHSL